MAAFHEPSKTELLAHEYTNGESALYEEAAKAQTLGDEIVTDAISEKTEMKGHSKPRKGKAKRNKDFDLDFDVEDELSKFDDEFQELKPKSRGAKIQTLNLDEKELAADPLAETEESATQSKTQKKKKKKKTQLTLEEVNTELQTAEEATRENAEPPQETESSAGKKKTKKQQKGPSQALRDQLRQALRTQEETDRLKNEEEDRKTREFELREEERLAKVERERLRKEKKKTQKKERVALQKLEGTFVSKEQKEKIKERQDKASAMQQAYGMKVGPSDTEFAATKIKYGARKRHRNRELAEDATPEPGVDNFEIVDVKDESPELLEPVIDSWEDLLEPLEAEYKQKVKDTWEDTDSSSSGDDSTDESPVDVPSELVPVPDSPLKTEPKDNHTPAANPPNGDTIVTETGTNKGDSSDSETELSSYEIARNRITHRREQANEARNKSKLRSPILCVLGHVDTGKTKILDKIRHTSVQDGEAGGITQQIGATFVPADIIKSQTNFLKEFTQKTEVLLPGLLIIDTPGHESFRNLRSRGSSLCDIAILVVDIMHGLEPQTIESINLLKKKKCKFIIALNKVDRLYDWRRSPHASIKDSLKKQKRNTADHFNERLTEIKLELNTQGLNVGLFWEKLNFGEYIPMVPTSAITGDGMGDLMAMMVLVSQKFMANQLMWSSEVEATIMEVKVTAGYGHTLDVVLKNGVVKEGDTIVLFGTEGPIVTQIRAILTPQPLKEMRVKGEFIHHQLIDNSQGIKIAGKDLEFAIASSPLLVPVKQDEVPVLVDEVNREMQAALTDFKLKDKGVYVQASTLGSMEALLEFLKTSKIPYSGINIGPIHRKDVIRCSTMLQHDAQFAVILAFDVRVDKDAQGLADELGIKIFTADIIYHLFDNFMAHRKDYAEKMKNENRHLAVYPVRLSIVPNCVFNSRDPLVMGVRIEEGVLMTGTPIHVPNKEIDIGIITSIEINHKPVERSRKGVEVCVKIETPPGDAPKMFERHFGYEDELVSKISRGSIDTMKNHFKEELTREDWELIVQLKKTFGIF